MPQGQPAALRAGPCGAGKAHALQDVISSIEVCPDFYARATLACSLGENDPLYAKHQAHAAAAV